MSPVTLASNKLRYCFSCSGVSRNGSTVTKIIRKEFVFTPVLCKSSRATANVVRVVGHISGQKEKPKKKGNRLIGKISQRLGPIFLIHQINLIILQIGKTVCRPFCIVVSHKKNKLVASNRNKIAAKITRIGFLEKTGKNVADDDEKGSAFFRSYFVPQLYPLRLTVWK